MQGTCKKYTKYLNKNKNKMNLTQSPSMEKIDAVEEQHSNEPIDTAEAEKNSKEDYFSKLLEKELPELYPDTEIVKEIKKISREYP